MDGSIPLRHNCQFEGDTFWDAQPVKADELWVMCMIITLVRYPLE